MAATYPANHDAVIVPAQRAPLEISQVPTQAPGPNEAVVRVQWTSSSPVDLHHADGGLLATYPHVLGVSFAGTVVALGSDDPSAEKPFSDPLRVGDKVFGFAWEKQHQQGFQTYVTVPRNLMGRMPEGMSMEAAVTAPANLVTAFHTCVGDLKLEMPWPIPKDWKPQEANDAILIWGAASSVGLFTIQVLHHWGYRNVLAVASKKHHDELAKLGARACFDYNEANVTEQILSEAKNIQYIVDCIGQLEGTLTPLTKVAKKGTKIAIMMPAILRNATAELEPLYSMHPEDLLKGEWAEDVELLGVRTFYYEKDEFFKWHLQPDIMPEMLAKGIVEPNRQRIVEGATLLERAQKALDLLRERAPSGERLVWKVSGEEPTM